jgi:hypothetical protein
MQAFSRESTIRREKFTYFELHGQNPENLYPKLNGYRYNGEKNLKKTLVHSLIIKYVKNQEKFVSFEVLNLYSYLIIILVT